MLCFGALVDLRIHTFGALLGPVVIADRRPSIMIAELHITDAINFPSPSGPFKTYQGAGIHTEWHGIGNGEFVNARMDPYLMRQLAMLSPPAHAQAAPWNIHGHGLQVGAS